MSVIIVGTTALRFHGFDVQPSDVDMFVSTTEEEVFYKDYGCDVIVVPEYIMKLIPNMHEYATPDAIYTIKCSHLGWDIKWDKHKRDVLWLKHQGCEIVNELYWNLVEYWSVENGKKDFLNFYQTKKDFFTDYVTYYYDHDELHKVVAYPFNPIYISLLEDGQEVAIDKWKFRALSFQFQIKLFKEEIAVIAAERWLIPPHLKGKYHWTQAWRLALKKMFVSLTKDWQTDFLIRNIEHFDKPDKAYFINLFNKGYIEDMKRVENAEQIIEELLDLYYTDEDCYRSFSELAYEMESIECVEVLDRDGGGEGEGEYFHVVFKYKDTIYKWVGEYYSYSGLDLDYDLYEVTPRQKTITVYE